jgi:hypothetical protein
VHFYAGTRRLIAKDKAGALDHFKQCVETAASTEPTFWSARAELDGLKNEKK